MILSKHYKCEICVVDIRTGRIDRFGEDCEYGTRVFIIYDGIHFDPLYLDLNPAAVNNEKKIKTKFSTKGDDDYVMMLAYQLGNEAKNARQFTDVNNFVSFDLLEELKFFFAFYNFLPKKMQKKICSRALT